jgi:predicted DsbA family dithiol-disulfide isomerase
MHLYEKLHQLQKKRPSDVKITMMHFPLDGCHEKGGTCLASRVVECAHMQGRGPDIAMWAFEHGRGLALDVAEKKGEALGLKMDTFKTCLDDPKTLERILADQKQGLTVDVEGTPTFFVNGYRVVGARPVEILERMLERVMVVKKP